MLKNSFRQETLIQQPEEKIRHIEIATMNAENSKKSLLNTSSGKFYTPETVGLDIATKAAEYVSNLDLGSVKIIDPFCGDGRLIVWFLKKIAPTNKHLDIYCWDYDKEAIKFAKENIILEAKKNKIDINLFTSIGDTFSSYLKCKDKFDLVITNPPWDVIKPEKNKLTHLDLEAKSDYLSSLKEYSSRLVNDYPLSKPTRMFAGWGFNLARAGIEVAIRLLKDSGLAILVSPSTLFNDQSSDNLRKWIIEYNNCIEISFYPAECRLFDNVDQSFVTFNILKSNSTVQIKYNSYDCEKRSLIHKLNYDKEFLEVSNYIIPLSSEINKSHIEILKKLIKLPKLESLVSQKKLWIGREVDETDFKKNVLNTGEHPFLKGINMERFEIKIQPNSFGDRMIKGNVESLNYNRIVWRDVSRTSQKRRMISTIIPRGWVCGNSLVVAYVKNENEVFLKAILGIISSFVFEFQVRLLSGTGHLSSNSVKSISIPLTLMDMSDHKLKELATAVECRIKGDFRKELVIETIVSNLYGLNKEEFKNILSLFPKVSDEEKLLLIKNYD